MQQRHKECRIPPGGNVALSAVLLIVDSVVQKVLLAMERGKYKFPGGTYDPIQDSSSEITALREVEEETSLKIPAETRIVSLGHSIFPDNQNVAGLAMIYGCSVPGISDRKVEVEEREIQGHIWAPLSAILSGNGRYNGVKLSKEVIPALQTFKADKGFDTVVDAGWMRVVTALHQPEAEKSEEKTETNSAVRAIA